ncbi:MAG: hypothetical protein MJE77_16935 [Proteobacteria bacterium]|nr:hypothetical protein [Pseudomonadota bacterium]
MKRRGMIVLAASLFASPWLAQTAGADPDRPTQLPWYQGVSEERQERAKQLYQEGYTLHRDLQFVNAAAKYQEALTDWENPEIRVELAIALNQIGQPLNAYQSLELAMKWGLDQLQPTDQDRIRDLQSSLMTERLAIIELRCDEPGTEIVFNGQKWFVGPGRRHRVVRPGTHAITASKPGYFPVFESVTVLPGNRATVALVLSVDRIVKTTRWSAWKPWAVVGAGVALGLTGSGLLWQSERDFDAAKASLDSECTSERPWCTPVPLYQQDRATRNSQLALGSLLTGGAAVAAGMVLVWMNLPSPQRTPDRNESKVELSPIVSEETVGVSAGLSF